MKKITQILEAKNIEIYSDSYIKSIDNADEFLLKFNANDNSDLKLMLDENYNNNFNFSVRKDYVANDIYTTEIYIKGNKTQSFAICGVK